MGARRGGGLRLPGSGLRVRVCKRSEAEAWASGDSASEPRAPTAIPSSHSFSRGRWVVKPLSGKPSSRSSRLGERPAWSWNRQPLPAGTWPALSQVPHKSRPAPRRLPARGVPRGRVPWSFHSRPRGPRKEVGGGPGSLIFGARVGTRQDARRRSPVAARAPSRFAWKAVAAPRVRPRATDPSLHLDVREGSPPDRSLGGSRPQRGSASFRKEARGPEGGGAPRASRAATHLVARGSHMAGAAASGAASRGTDAAGGGSPGGVPCSQWLGPRALTSGVWVRGPRRPAVCSRRPIPSSHVVATARKLSRARRRCVGGGLCHRVFKRGVSMYPILRASDPVGWLSAAFGKRVLRADHHEGPGEHTAPLQKVSVTVTSRPSWVAAIVGGTEEMVSPRPWPASAPGLPSPTTKKLGGQARGRCPSCPAAPTSCLPPLSLSLHMEYLLCVRPSIVGVLGIRVGRGRRGRRLLDPYWLFHGAGRGVNLSPQAGIARKGSDELRSWGAVRTTSGCHCPFGCWRKKLHSLLTHRPCLVLNFSGTGITFFHAGDLAQSESRVRRPLLGRALADTASWWFSHPSGGPPHQTGPMELEREEQ